MKKLTVVVMLLVVVSGLFATPLWNGTTAGMSVDEVRELFPNIEFVVEDEEVTLYSFLSYLEDNDYIEDGVFFFIEEKLAAVKIKLSSFEDVRSLLMIVKYGPYDDYFSYVDPSINYNSEYWIWINGTTLISLERSHLGISKNPEYAAITYYDIDSIHIFVPGIEWF